MRFCNEIYEKLKQDGENTRTRIATIAALSPLDHVNLWRDVQMSSHHNRDDAVRFFENYFRTEIIKQPSVALAFLVAEVESEPDDEIVAMCAKTELLSTLLEKHTGRMLDLVESRCDLPRLRWLLGAEYELIRLYRRTEEWNRLLALSNAESFEKWRATSYKSYPLDFDAASTIQIANAYIEDYFRTYIEKARDDLHEKLSDFLHKLKNRDRHFLLRVILEVERIEKKDSCRAYLAAGPLEDLIKTEDSDIIDMIVAEASHNMGFKNLLGGVWLYSVSPDVETLVEKARDCRTDESASERHAFRITNSNR